MALKRFVQQFSLSREFLAVGTAVTLVVMLTFGFWVGNQIETGVVNRTGQIASVYVESILTAQLRDWPGNGPLPAETHLALDRVFVEGTSHSKVLDFKIWTPDGRIIYGANHDLVGRAYPLEEHVEKAFAGKVQSHIVNLGNWHEPDRKPALEGRQLEIVVPMRIGPTNKVTAVAEFDHSMDGLDGDIRSSQVQAWVMTVLFALSTYALIFVRISRASDTIAGQQRTLQEQVLQLRTAFEDNQRMHQRLIEASEQTTALSERYLNRVAADLHDGPAQELAYALMRFGDMTIACNDCTSANGDMLQLAGEIHQVLLSSLTELRSIAAGLGVPGIDNLSIAETAQRAVHDAERQSNREARVEIDPTLGPAPIALRITLYRVIRESLTNCWRYAGAVTPEVRVGRSAADLVIEVADQGSGFDPVVALASGRLGLLFMRERVRLAGGAFAIDSAAGRGTTLRVHIPLLEK